MRDSKYGAAKEVFDDATRDVQDRLVRRSIADLLEVLKPSMKLKLLLESTKESLLNKVEMEEALKLFFYGSWSPYSLT